MSTHIVPLRVYFLVFATLLVLTGLTVWVAFVDLGAWGTPVALTIASTKAFLVILFFMHVRYGSHLVWVFATSGFAWLVILLAFTLSDYYSRDRLVIYGPAYDVELDPESVQVRPTR
jgi:cytochrome c oxidase subunit IV